MKHKVYIETSVISYLTAWRSRDLVIAGNQETTREWWDRKNEFDVFISQFVLDEASAGDASVGCWATRNPTLPGKPSLLRVSSRCGKVNIIFIGNKGARPLFPMPFSDAPFSVLKLLLLWG